jgi:D-alanine-D-alanine ligase
MAQFFKKRIAVLRGGLSTEHDVSLRTGACVIAALNSSYVIKDIIVTKSGEWLVDGFVKRPEQALLGVDVVFIALHGKYGEDGVVQRILEQLQVPYTGSGSFASALAMNKAFTKDHLKKYASEIKQAPHMLVRKDALQDHTKIAYTIEQLFGPEYIIKPVDGGSSIGTLHARRENLATSLQQALETSDAVLVEKFIAGIEATVGILENFRNQAHYQLPEIEIRPPAKTSFFSADVKYSGETEEICPGRFSTQEKQTLLDAALTIHKTLQLRQYSRSDFIVAKDGVYFLEVNTLPGLTSESLFPKSIEAVGSSYKELVTHLVESASV